MQGDPSSATNGDSSSSFSLFADSVWSEDSIMMYSHSGLENPPSPGRVWPEEPDQIQDEEMQDVFKAAPDAMSFCATTMSLSDIAKPVSTSPNPEAWQNVPQNDVQRGISDNSIDGQVRQYPTRPYSPAPTQGVPQQATGWLNHGAAVHQYSSFPRFFPASSYTAANTKPTLNVTYTVCCDEQLPRQPSPAAPARLVEPTIQLPQSSWTPATILRRSERGHQSQNSCITLPFAAPLEHSGSKLSAIPAVTQSHGSFESHSTVSEHAMSMQPKARGPSQKEKRKVNNRGAERVRKYKCPKCEEVFTRTSSCRRHQEKKHSKSPQKSKCSHCDRECRDAADLARHQRRAVARGDPQHV